MLIENGAKQENIMCIISDPLEYESYRCPLPSLSLSSEEEGKKESEGSVLLVDWCHAES